MIIVVTVLLPINYNKGKGNNFYSTTNGDNAQWNVAGLDTLSWQNIDPTRTHRYWAHLVCAILVVSWSLFRMYREKIHFIDARQRFLTSPEHRLKASARTILVTNIPSEYRSKEALEALYDVFVDNDDRSRLVVWVNRDYKTLRKLVAKRRSLRHALEKEELRIMRLCNKNLGKNNNVAGGSQTDGKDNRDSRVSDDEYPMRQEQVELRLNRIFEQDCAEERQLWRNYLKPSAASQVSLVRGKDDDWKSTSFFKFWVAGDSRKAPKVAWLRTEIARLTIHIDALLTDLDNDTLFKKQNSAFI
ncbi:MAG: hypothetical protein Q9198_011289, partial [Flavoplaca austrocitrina]